MPIRCVMRRTTPRPTAVNCGSIFHVSWKVKSTKSSRFNSVSHNKLMIKQQAYGIIDDKNTSPVNDTSSHESCNTFQYSLRLLTASYNAVLFVTSPLPIQLSGIIYPVGSRRRAVKFMAYEWDAFVYDHLVLMNSSVHGRYDVSPLKG